MPVSRKPRRPHQTRQNRAALCSSEPKRINAVFAPLEAALKAIWDTGEVEIIDDEAVIKTATDTAPLERAVNGIVEFLRIYYARRERDFDAPQLRQLVTRINDGTAFGEKELNAAKAEIKTMRAMCARITIAEAREIAKIVEQRSNAGAPVYARIKQPSMMIGE